VLLQLKVKALWNDQTAISSSWHSLPFAENCLFKVSIFPVSSSYNRHLSGTSIREFKKIHERDNRDRKLACELARESTRSKRNLTGDSFMDEEAAKNADRPLDHIKDGEEGQKEDGSGKRVVLRVEGWEHE